ncbi:serine hydrolase domain-containing protein [Paenibacillus mucilaginosus]|uniref:Beta-lactamase n=1 Tax=Paenibacillus mucilaginosus (strain KNP414) TaxID=1036673 RepID=F8FAL0_PAEMK|nr:serine hydrolase domain-containing protein [Paenibacillus mucilaginosus]AEI41099.1 beta-lactamase [Paenibacillus mucilaginosus KNP414]MCG7211464.1 beta-lactamase family protein [Paenibacillus mucilaginosus]WDM30160.1 beta-lactamase family protein [Paenibacillus mucilaginosus]
MDHVIEEVMSDPKVLRWANRPAHQLTVGVLHPSGRKIWSSGGESGETNGTGRAYEIGSITKTMTGLMLAAGEQQALWSRSDRLSDVNLDLAASPFAKQTTLLDLVTHTSGLPDVPGNFKASITDRLNPYANYDEARLIEAVLAEKPKSGSRHRYSNYGFGLLGWLLSRRLGTTLDDALTRQVFHPLGMPDTYAGGRTPAPAQLLPVYNSKGKVLPPWDFHEAMGGAGAVRSTAADMLNYLEAHVHPDSHSLSPAVEEGLKEHYAIMPSRGIGIGYGWMRYREKDGTVTHWHNGGTYGSSSFIAFNRSKGAGVVILSNNGSTMWSQLAPMLGLRLLSVDALATRLTKKLFAASAG